MNEAKYGFIDIPSSWLKSIVVGLDAKTKLKDKLHRIGSEMNIPVFFANIHENDYQVEIPGFGVDGVLGRNNYEKLVDSKLLEIR